MAEDGDEKRKGTKNCYGEPEIKHDVPRAYIPRVWAQVELRAERKSGVAEEGGEFGQLGIIALAQETLKEFEVGPVAHKKDGAGEQRADGCAETKGERESGSGWSELNLSERFRTTTPSAQRSKRTAQNSINNPESRTKKAFQWETSLPLKPERQ